MAWEGSSKETDALRREIRTLRARVDKMSEVSRRVTEIWDLNVVLQEIVDGARSLTDARHGAVGVFDGSGRIREFFTSGIHHTSEIVTTVELVLGNGNGNYNPPAPVNGHGHHDEAKKP